MKVRCKSTPLPEDLQAWLNARYMTEDYLAESSLQPGAEYGVYGISIDEGQTSIVVDLGDLCWSYEPLALFDITDPSVSRHWQIRRDDDGAVEFFPAVFFEVPYLLEDASNDVPAAIALFRSMEAMMRAEFQHAKPGRT